MSGVLISARYFAGWLNICTRRQLSLDFLKNCTVTLWCKFILTFGVKMQSILGTSSRKLKI